MSMFGNSDKDWLYDEIKDFLKTHSIRELMEILAYALDD